MQPRRIIADIGLFLALFWLPWWLFLVLGCVFVFLFWNYIELIFAAIIFDSLYSVPMARFAHIQFLATIIALALVLFAGFLKKQLRIHLYL